MNDYQIAVAGYVPKCPTVDNISSIIDENTTYRQKIENLADFSTSQFKQRHLRYAAMKTKSYKGGSKKLLQYFVDRGLDPSDALDFACSPQIATELMDLGANPSESSFFSKIIYGESFSGKGFRKHGVLVRNFTMRIMRGGKLHFSIQDWYTHNVDVSARTSEVVLNMLKPFGYNVEACLGVYDLQCVLNNVISESGVGYHFVERFYEYVKFARFAMRLNRVIGVEEGAVKRIKVEGGSAICRFMEERAPVEVVQNIMNFLGFYPKFDVVHY